MGAKQHGFGLRCVNNDAHHHVACLAEFSDAFAGVAAIFGKFIGDFLAHIEDMHVEARSAQRGSHAGAHGA